jgi:hypothetical protein
MRLNPATLFLTSLRRIYFLIGFEANGQTLRTIQEWLNPSGLHNISYDQR